ncbi:hypothetical protein H0H81_001981 [Sphagnurus paluster]|uniref:Riboflavin kinase n=1 Tax=Sphagnurus paluster TaxID=117069 RepID=A0A9P7GPK8_9AGAR|nr:hypothetical protein H0H81_001981 [Sphagnurus paluster]
MAARPAIVGPPQPEPPFPVLLAGPVQHGFGRGSKDLDCPTANLPDESITPLISVAQHGIYYGYAQVIPCPDSPLPAQDLHVFPMVMSLGLNPVYKNEKLSAEIHIMHEFESDFYGLEIRAVVLGYIRPELDYVSRGACPSLSLLRSTLTPHPEALIDDINTDKAVALASLARPAYQAFARDPHFLLEQ